MGVTWNHCFLCQQQQTMKISSALKPSHHSLLKYLVGGRCGVGDEHHELYKDIVQLAGDSGRKLANMGYSVSDKNGGQMMLAAVLFCGECERIAEQVLEMHLQLEGIQMRMADKLRTVREAVITNSRVYGKNEEVNRDFELMEGRVKEYERVGGDLEGFVKLERQFLDAVDGFQKAVWEKDKMQVNIPLVYLDRCDKVRKTQVWKSSSTLFPNKDTEPKDALMEAEAEIICLSEDEEKGKIEGADKNNKKEELEPPFVNLSEDEEVIMIELDGGDGDMEEKMCPSGDDGGSLLVKDSADGSLCALEETEGSPKIRPVALSSLMYVKKRRSPRKTRKKIKTTAAVRSEPKEKVQNQKATKAFLKPMDNPFNCTRLDSPRRIYLCELCPFSSIMSCSIEQHVKEHEIEGKNNHECCHCKQTFTQTQSLKWHMYFWHNPSLKCDLCTTTRNKRYEHAEIVEHLREKHGKTEVFKCELCGSPFGCFKNLTLHMQMPVSGAKLKCQLCLPSSSVPNQTPYFTWKSHLLKHLYEIHGFSELVHKCDYLGCTKEFFLRRMKAKHMNLHTKKFTCKECDKVFVDSNELQKHIRIKHKNDLPFQCDLCPLRFKTKLTFQNHQLQTHGGEVSNQTIRTRASVKTIVGVFKCEVCPAENAKSFPTRSSLKQHMEGVHGDGFKCRTCGKKYTIKSNLSTHERIHRDGKKYVCEICGYRTEHQSYFQHHKRMHSEERNYCCSQCAKTFKFKRALEKHMRVHTGEARFTYQCELCGAKYTQKRSLIAHKIRVHGEVEEETKMNMGRNE